MSALPITSWSDVESDEETFSADEDVQQKQTHLISPNGTAVSVIGGAQEASDNESEHKTEAMVEEEGAAADDAVEWESDESEKSATAAVAKTSLSASISDSSEKKERTSDPLPDPFALGGDQSSA